MPAPFAALETRVNAAVLAHLSNEELLPFTPVGGSTRGVSGIWDDDYAVSLDGLLSASTPAFTCATADVSDATEGATLVRGIQGYRVVEVQPTAGLTVLRLRKGL